MKNMARILVILGLVTAIGTLQSKQAQADEADVFFDDSFVHKVTITFTDADWYNTLYDSHSKDPDDPYFPAAVECDGVAFDQVGVRFKGNSSFTIPGVKKSFKIDFNEYTDDTTYVGLKKLNLNNGYKDPTMMRAKIFLDFASAYVPTVRAVHTRLYVNGTYGQALPGVSADDLITEGEKGRIIFMSEDNDFRANLGCQNGTDGDISINYEKFDNTGASLGVGVMNLSAYSNDQVNRVFQDSSPVNGYAVVWSDTEGAAFYCYGSVVDKVTGDPTTILPQ